MPVDSRERDRLALAARQSIEQAYRELESTPGFQAWFGGMPWRVQEVIRLVPPNRYYCLRRGPFPSEILFYCEDNQIVTLRVFVHSPHSPRVVFDVPPSELRLYRGLPRDWEILLNSKVPPIYDLTKLPAKALEPAQVDCGEGFDGMRQRHRQADVNRQALHTLGRIARWLFW